MTALVDTSVLIDYLRGHQQAAVVLERERVAGPLHASEITRLEILAGMRSDEDDATRSLLSALEWHPVDADVAEDAAALGRRWLPSHHTIDGADLAIAATAIRTGSGLLTRNVRHFPCSPIYRRRTCSNDRNPAKSSGGSACRWLRMPVAPHAGGAVDGVPQ